MGVLRVQQDGYIPVNHHEDEENPQIEGMPHEIQQRQTSPLQEKKVVLLSFFGWAVTKGLAFSPIKQIAYPLGTALLAISMVGIGQWPRNTTEAAKCASFAIAGVATSYVITQIPLEDLTGSGLASTIRFIACLSVDFVVASKIVSIKFIGH